MSAPWLTIVGVGEGGLSALDDATLALIAMAETVFGSERFTTQIKKKPHQNIVMWTPPFSSMIEQIIMNRGKSTVVLASGDPNWFGAGATLGRFLDPDEYEILPAPSSFQLAAASMRWPLQNIQTVSFHARSVDNLPRFIFPGARILALTSDARTLMQVATGLIEAGYASSNLTVLENLGGENQRKIAFPAFQAHQQNIGDFYVLAIECIAENGASSFGIVPGLPDDVFEHDGQLTKREVRAITLSGLVPYPGALLWDVGAGSGAVGIEWMRTSPFCRAIGFEKDHKRCARMERNKKALGTPDMKVVCGDAGSNIVGQPTPDAIFLGGDVANETLFETCWKALKPGGRLVANAVTLQGITALNNRQNTYGGTLTTIAISSLKPLGTSHAMRPALPVTQWAVTKPKTGIKQ